ncbi:MAG: hypothetical protein MJ123_08810 [Lachnospiraceae bacterium]|nr:hypothetical protein [Lachnospiraceae bacterium]
MGKKQKFEDDGRTIANMNVEGMPWYNPAIDNTPGGLRELRKASKEQHRDEMTKAQTFAMIRGVVGAALLVGLVFVVAFGLFILLCLKLWV